MNNAPQRLSLNMRDMPRCPHAPPDKEHTSYTGDGAHRWGPEQNIGRCLREYHCQDCGLVMEVDSSD